ncbi:MAG TPA: DUF3159 domain-containing protein [Mycobacteriales bacterium]|nr:DUF3159 domain-containing protein [Mycobacteriales bacterium]
MDGGPTGPAGDRPERVGADRSARLGPADRADQADQVDLPDSAESPPDPADLVDSADPHDDSDDSDDGPQPPFRDMMLGSIGGWRGMFDSAFPVVVFVLANAVGGLRAAVWSAVVAGVVLMTVRLALKQTVQQALSGFVGVALAAFIAARTGQARGFFLLGIWASFIYAGVFAVSVLARWPVVGVIWEYVDGGGNGWRRERLMLRIYTWTTLLWTAVFLSRGLVQRFLYNQDRTGWLAFARLAMGYPITAIALGVTLLAVRRARRVRLAGRPGTDPTSGTTVPADD